MNRVNLLTIVLISVIFSSCAFHSGTYTSNAHLEPGKFQVLGFASGTAKTTHVFGIGGLDQTALVHQARIDMYKNYVLDSVEVFANVSVDFKRSYFIIVATTVVTLTADVVRTGEFDTSLERSIFGSKVVEDEPIGIKPIPGRNIAFVNKNRLVRGTITHTDYVDKILVRSTGGYSHKVLKNDLYYTDGEMPATMKIKPGDKVIVKSGGLSKTGTVVGVNKANSLIELPDLIISISTEDLIRQNQENTLPEKK